MITLRKKAETTDTITLEWDSVPGAVGYRFQSAAQPKWSHTFDPTRTEVKFSKAASYKVEALGVEDAGQYPAATPPPPPPVGNLPRVITQGGTYSGTAKGDAGTPAVTIQTTAPVVIEDSHIENTAGGHLIQQTFQYAAQVTVRRTQFIGIAGGQGRAINSEKASSWLVENCTVTRTGGFYFVSPLGPVTVRRNKSRNIQGASLVSQGVRQFVQFNGVSVPVIVEWNEAINEFGLSRTEDVISLYKTSGAIVRHNYIHGSYPTTAAGGHSGTGIIVGDAGGSNNYVHDNIVIATTNVGIAIPGGQNNLVENNRIVSDGKAPDGTPLAGANVGIAIWDLYGGNPPFGNNRAKGNVVGWVKAGGQRNDWWTPGAANNVATENTRLPDPITKATEDAEWQRWQAKLAASGVTLGA